MNISKKTVEIDLSKSGTYVVSNGDYKFLPMPPTNYGKHEIQWHGGKMAFANNVETIKG